MKKTYKMYIFVHAIFCVQKRERENKKKKNDILKIDSMY